MESETEPRTDDETSGSQPEENQMPPVPKIVKKVNHMREIRERVGRAAAAEKAQRGAQEQQGDPQQN